jgi:hypothetical protein
MNFLKKAAARDTYIFFPIQTPLQGVQNGKEQKGKKHANAHATKCHATKETHSTRKINLLSQPRHAQFQEIKLREDCKKYHGRPIILQKM